jgi:hypothetical protein
MTCTVRAHFDGKAIIPDEPVDLPVGKPLQLTVEPLPDRQERLPVFADPSATHEDRRRAIQRIFASGVEGVNLPDEAMSRESI